jgi:hypothetical protein
MIFGRRSRLQGMEHGKTGAELLLSEPEIVAWLGLDDKHGDVPELPRRAESARGRRAHVNRQVDRPGEVRQAVPTARTPRIRMIL